MSNETITITMPPSPWDTTMNSSSGIMASDGITVSDGISTISIQNDAYGIGIPDTIVLTGGTGINTVSDTITFSGLDEYVNVTKAEHNELIDRVAKLEAMLAEEAELRATHPALKMAYDEYRLLLVLAKKHDSDNLTDE